MLQGSSLLMMAASDTTHHGRKSGLMATTFIHWDLFSAGPSRHNLLIEYLHFGYQPFPHPGRAPGLGTDPGDTGRGPLHRYYTVSTDLPLMMPFLRMWMGRGRGLHHPLPTVLLLSGPLGLAIPLYPR